MADERVVLNVGGQRFEASIATLTKLPDSLLGLMFADENRASLKPDSNGEYFFDRYAPTIRFFLPIQNAAVSWAHLFFFDPALRFSAFPAFHRSGSQYFYEKMYRNGRLFEIILDYLRSGT